MLLLLAIGCGQKLTKENNKVKNKGIAVKTTQVSIKNSRLREDILATSVYLDKNEITSPIAGFVIKNYVNIGSSTTKNQLLFVLETEEHRALSENNKLKKSNLSGIGIFEIRAPSNGFVSNVFHQNRDFVQKGMPLCSFANRDNIVFKAYLPYQYHQSVKKGDRCIITLPDGTIADGYFSEILNTVDAPSQTEVYFIKAYKELLIPEQLNVTISFTKALLKSAQILPRAAVLSNETLSEYWIMQVWHDTLAIKMPVKIGVGLNDSIQIMSPQIGIHKKIIMDGNYGLEDSARVYIIK